MLTECCAAPIPLLLLLLLLHLLRLLLSLLPGEAERWSDSFSIKHIDSFVSVLSNLHNAETYVVFCET